jgi:hypothetical protein
MKPPTIGELLQIYKGPEEELDIIRSVGILSRLTPLTWKEFAEFVLRRALRLTMPRHCEEIRKHIPAMMDDLDKVKDRIGLPGNYGPFSVAVTNSVWLQWTGQTDYIHLPTGEPVRHLGSTKTLSVHTIHFLPFWHEASELWQKFCEDRPDAERSPVVEAHQQVRSAAESVPVEGIISDYPRGSVD